jgi:hypothetical protein
MAGDERRGNLYLYGCTVYALLLVALVLFRDVCWFSHECSDTVGCARQLPTRDCSRSAAQQSPWRNMRYTCYITVAGSRAAVAQRGLNSRNRNASFPCSRRK